MVNIDTHTTPELTLDGDLGVKITEYFGEDSLRQAIKHCISYPHQESGGYIYKQAGLSLFDPLPNISTNPDTNLEFEKSIEILNKIFDYQNSGIAFVHSHVYQDVDGSFEASSKDLDLVSVDVLDWIIVDTQTQDLLFIGGCSDFSKMHGLIGAQVRFRI